MELFANSTFTLSPTVVSWIILIICLSLYALQFWCFEPLASFNLDRKYTWVYCNEDFKGYYLNQYSQQIFEAFSEALQINVVSLNEIFSRYHKILLCLLIVFQNAFNRAERANIIHNSFTLAYANKFDYDIPAKIVAYLDYREQDYVPWRTFTYHVSRIATVLEHKPGYYGISVGDIDNNLVGI